MKNNKLKRVLSLGLVCLMFTPIISFATAKNKAVEGLTNEVINRGPFIIGDVNENELPEAERQKLALEKAVVKEVENGEIYGHKLITSNDKYELYRKDSNCSIIIRDIASGAIFTSTVSEEDAKARNYSAVAAAPITSGIALSYVEDKDGKVMLNSPIGVNTATIKYKDAKDGFTASISFPNYEISFDVVVSLDDEGLHVAVPEDKIVEENATYSVGSMYIFNGLGMTEKGDREGYMILPDGNGIRVDFENNFYVYGGTQEAVKYSSGYMQRVYGSDFSFDLANTSTYDETDMIGTSNSTESIIAPFWGMVHTDTQFGVLGIITKGEESAKIEGILNGVAGLYENYSGCRIIYRDTYMRSLSDTNQYQGTVTAAPENKLVGDVEITFLFTTGDKANYIGLAESYRNKLIADGDLVKTTDGTFKTRLDFFGVDKEEFLVFKTDVVATTVDNVKDILADLKSNGVEDILAIYTGWQQGGYYETPIKKYDVANSIGGNSAMNDLFKELEGTGVDLYLMTDMQLINKAVESSSYDAVKTYGQRTKEIFSPFLKVYKNFRYLIPELSNEYMVKLSDDMKKDGIGNIAFSGISTSLFSYFKNDTQYTRQDVIDYYVSALDKVSADMDIVLENPFKYMWKYTDSYIDMPLYSSMFVYASDEIPFVSSVLKGTIDVYSEYVNFEANATEYFLKLVETGVYPSFLLTEESPTELLHTNSSWIYSSEYEQYDERIAEYHKELKAINDKVSGAVIVAHEKSDVGLAKTTYSNGVVVYVNFSEKAIIENGETIEALSYKVGEAE